MTYNNTIKYNNIHKTIKMKHNDVSSSTYIDFYVEKNDKDLTLKLALVWEYQNIKTSFKKVTN